MHEHKLKRGFNFLSGFYDLLLFITSGKIIIKSQTSLIENLPHCTKALLVGEGTGNFLKHLAVSGKVDHIIYLDISEGMRKKAQKKLKTVKSKAKVEFRTGSFEQLNQEEVFDLISTNYFLDVFATRQLDEYIPLLLTHLKPGGIWYCTDFYTPPQLRLKDYLFKPVLLILYLFFRIISNIPARKLSPYFQKLEANGLEEKFTRYFLFGLIKSAIYINR